MLGSTPWSEPGWMRENIMAQKSSKCWEFPKPPPPTLIYTKLTKWKKGPLPCQWHGRTSSWYEDSWLGDRLEAKWKGDAAYHEMWKSAQKCARPLARKYPETEIEANHTNLLECNIWIQTNPVHTTYRWDSFRHTTFDYTSLPTLVLISVQIQHIIYARGEARRGTVPCTRTNTTCNWECL